MSPFPASDAGYTEVCSESWHSWGDSDNNQVAMKQAMVMDAGKKLNGTQCMLLQWADTWRDEGVASQLGVGEECPGCRGHFELLLWISCNLEGTLVMTMVSMEAKGTCSQTCFHFRAPFLHLCLATLGCFHWNSRHFTFPNNARLWNC